MPIQPTREQIQDLVSSDHEGPVVMLNLLRFRGPSSGDGGEAGDGRESYGRYGESVRSLLEAVGGRVLWQGRADSVVIGDEADDWDAVILVEYPSRARFLEMVSRDDYREVSSHRTNALVDSRLISCTEIYRAT
jgi:uncharacterized protein (DUF1330 family)